MYLAMGQRWTNEFLRELAMAVMSLACSISPPTRTWPDRKFMPDLTGIL